MKHGVLQLVLLMAVMPGPLGSQARQKAATPVVSSPEEIAKSIQKLESDLRIATMKGEASFFEEHLADGYVETDLEGKVDGKSVSGSFRFTRIWIKDGLDWKLAAEQMTSIAG